MLPPSERGFSLVELSIVLVILGLLTGGILAGQSLIRAAELRAIPTEYQRYVAATQSFRDKYMAIPGDMNNATRFWSRHSADAWCTTNSSAAVATPGTCDGDNNGLIGWGLGASQTGETFQLWRQLALAGLIEGGYTGIAGSGGSTIHNLGTNAPQSRIPNGGWFAYTWPNYAGTTADYAIDYGHFILVGATTAGSPSGPLLRPEEAWGIDTKIDDGNPASGKVIARFWNNLCAVADDGTSANNDYAASYKLSDTSVRCALFFRQIF